MTASPATIRAPRVQDLDAIAVLHATCFADEPWSRTDLALLLASPGSVGLVGESPQGGIVGFLLLRRAADEAEVLTLAVAPEQRRRGLGRDLLDGGLAILLAEGTRDVFLEVAADNPAAETLYRAAGFRTVGRRPRYYRRGVDALVLRLVLPRELSK